MTPSRSPDGGKRVHDDLSTAVKPEEGEVAKMDQPADGSQPTKRVKRDHSVPGGDAHLEPLSNGVVEPHSVSAHTHSNQVDARQNTENRPRVNVIMKGKGSNDQQGWGRLPEKILQRILLEAVKDVALPEIIDKAWPRENQYTRHGRMVLGKLLCRTWMGSARRVCLGWRDAIDSHPVWYTFHKTLLPLALPLNPPERPSSRHTPPSLYNLSRLHTNSTCIPCAINEVPMDRLMAHSDCSTWTKYLGYVYTCPRHNDNFCQNCFIGRFRHLDRDAIRECDAGEVDDQGQECPGETAMCKHCRQAALWNQICRQLTVCARGGVVRGAANIFTGSMRELAYLDSAEGTAVAVALEMVDEAFAISLGPTRWQDVTDQILELQGLEERHRHLLLRGGSKHEPDSWRLARWDIMRNLKPFMGPIHPADDYKQRQRLVNMWWWEYYSTGNMGGGVFDEHDLTNEMRHLRYRAAMESFILQRIRLGFWVLPSVEISLLASLPEDPSPQLSSIAGSPLLPQFAALALSTQHPLPNSPTVQRLAKPVPFPDFQPPIPAGPVPPSSPPPNSKTTAQSQSQSLSSTPILRITKPPLFSLEMLREGTQYGVFEHFLPRGFVATSLDQIFAQGMRKIVAPALSRLVGIYRRSQRWQGDTDGLEREFAAWGIREVLSALSKDMAWVEDVGVEEGARRGSGVGSGGGRRTSVIERSDRDTRLGAGVVNGTGKDRTPTRNPNEIPIQHQRVNVRNASPKIELVVDDAENARSGPRRMEEYGIVEVSAGSSPLGPTTVGVGVNVDADVDVDVDVQAGHEQGHVRLRSGSSSSTSSSLTLAESGSEGEGEGEGESGRVRVIAGGVIGKEANSGVGAAAGTGAGTGIGIRKRTTSSSDEGLPVTPKTPDDLLGAGVGVVHGLEQDHVRGGKGMGQGGLDGGQRKRKLVDDDDDGNENEEVQDGDDMDWNGHGHGEWDGNGQKVVNSVPHPQSQSSVSPTITLRIAVRGAAGTNGKTLHGGNENGSDASNASNAQEAGEDREEDDEEEWEYAEGSDDGLDDSVEGVEGGGNGGKQADVNSGTNVNAKGRGNNALGAILPTLSNGVQTPLTILPRHVPSLAHPSAHHPHPTHPPHPLPSNSNGLISDMPDAGHDFDLERFISLPAGAPEGASDGTHRLPFMGNDGEEEEEEEGTDVMVDDDVESELESDESGSLDDHEHDDHDEFGEKGMSEVIDGRRMRFVCPVGMVPWVPRLDLWDKTGAGCGDRDGEIGGDEDEVASAIANGSAQRGKGNVNGTGNGNANANGNGKGPVTGFDSDTSMDVDTRKDGTRAPVPALAQDDTDSPESIFASELIMDMFYRARKELRVCRCRICERARVAQGWQW